MLLFVLAALGIWIAAFFPFLSGQKPIIDDAFPYYEHVKYYLESMSAGIYPLWDPVRDFGVDNEFYLRRIGEFNPAYLLILVLQKCGVGFLVAHRIFVAAYFILGVAGFYALAKQLFKNRLTHLCVVFCVIFSSLGTLAFESYLLLVVVPLIWFLFFVAAFVQKPSRSTMLGGSFCLMIICITYIPYYFLTVIFSGVIVAAIVFNKSVLSAISKSMAFLKAQKMFAGLCIVLVCVGLIPGLMWYQQSSKSEMSVVYRHSGASHSNAAALHINVVNEGGIIAPKLVDTLFFDLNKIKLGEFYMPLFAFLLILSACFVPLTRRMAFFFVWGMLIYVIGLADASPVHRFLYEHVFFFKYFRNLQFFLWLGVLPILILAIGEMFDALMNTPFTSRRSKAGYIVYVIATHILIAVLFKTQTINDVISMTYGTIFLSMIFFISLAFKNNVQVQRVLPILLLAAISIQSYQVFGHMKNNTPSVYAQSLYDAPYMRFTLPKTDNLDDLLSDQSPERYLNQPFYSTKAFQDLHQNVNRSTLSLYIKPRLLLYDSMPDVDFTNFDGSNLTIVTQDSPHVQVKVFEPNRVVFATQLDHPKYLVYNSVYHSRWRAFCDGKQLDIFQANHAFTGILVPAGRHTIELLYQAPWRTWLAFALELIFALTFLGVVVLLCKQKI